MSPLLLSWLIAGSPYQIESRARWLDVPALVALTEEQEVAFIEAHRKGRAPQVVLFARLSVDPDRTFDAIWDVATYPKALPSVVRTRILKKKPGMIGFEWELEAPLFNLKGRRTMRGKRPSLIEVRGSSGDLRHARERFELFEVAGGGTLVAFYRCLDIENAGPIFEATASDDSMRLAVTIATGFVHLRELKRHLEKVPPPARAGRRPKQTTRFEQVDPETGPLASPGLRMLQERGLLALITSRPDGSMAQAALVTRLSKNGDRFVEVVHTPERYGEFMKSFSKIRVTKIGPLRKRLDWTLDVPVISVTGASLLSFRPDRSIDIVEAGGGSAWKWSFVKGDDGAVTAVYYVYQDVETASWATRRLVKAQPLLQHGIGAAAGAVTVQAMKVRSQQLAK